MRLNKFLPAVIFSSLIGLTSCGGSALDRAKECDNLAVNVFFSNPTYDERNEGAEGSFETNSKTINSNLKVWSLVESITEYVPSTKKDYEGAYTSCTYFEYVNPSYHFDYGSISANIDTTLKLRFTAIPKFSYDEKGLVETGVIGQETFVKAEAENPRRTSTSGYGLQLCDLTIIKEYEQTSNGSYENAEEDVYSNDHLSSEAKTLYQRLGNSNEKYDEFVNAYLYELSKYCVDAYKQFLEENNIPTQYLMVAFD